MLILEAYDNLVSPAVEAFKASSREASNDVAGATDVVLEAFEAHRDLVLHLATAEEKCDATEMQTIVSAVFEKIRELVTFTESHSRSREWHFLKACCESTLLLAWIHESPLSLTEFTRNAVSQNKFWYTKLFIKAGSQACGQQSHASVVECASKLLELTKQLVEFIETYYPKGVSDRSKGELVSSASK